MFVDARPDLETVIDEMVASVSERFDSAGKREKLSGLQAVLLGVSAVATHNDVSAESQASLAQLFDYRSRLHGLSTSSEIANLLTSSEVALLPEEDQELAGRIITAIAV